MRRAAFHGCVFALALAAVPAAADERPTARGTFKSKTISLEIKSAAAFRGKSLMDKEDVLLVAVSNAGIKPEILEAYYDRARAIDKRVKDDETGVVLFEFRPDGRYRGYSFYFGPGNGCGYCGGGDVSSVRLVNGRLAGTLKDSEKERSFEIDLDVPILSDDHGAKLPDGGGAPGKAYLAYHAALEKGDPVALKPVLSEDSLKIYARAEEKKDLAGYVRYLAKEHPTKAVKITRGFAGSDKAVLLVDGETGYAKVTGEVVLVKEKGTWRVDDELMDVKLD